MKYKFSEEDYQKIMAARKANRDKQTDARLKVLKLRCEGKTLAEISKETGFHLSHVSNLIRKYFQEGLSSVAEKHYPGNRRNMTLKEEAAFLEPYRERAEKGQTLDVKEIEAAYEERVGHRFGSGQIYRVLGRHGWRKVMPRSRHPKKASEEAIAASKKLRKKLNS